MPSNLNLDAPGLTSRCNADGSFRYYWRASKPAVAAGYKPTVVRLHAPDSGVIDLDNPVHRDFVAVLCQTLQAQMIEALGGMGDKPAFDGTLRALIEMYESHPYSPFQSVRSSTRRVYLSDLRKLRAAAGAAPLAKIGADDIRRWYQAALGDGRVRSAHGLMAMLRTLMTFGVVQEIPNASRIRSILAGMRFTTPGPRQVRPTYEQARLVFDKAVELGALSIAFGTALQFEGMLRQYDVTGVWETGIQSPIMQGRMGWRGPTWGNIVGGVFKWQTGKKGRRVEIDLSPYSMIIDAMKLVTPGLPGAPLIIDERTGLPYWPDSYSRRWRQIADAAGFPSEIWNRDLRAGGVTEGEAAGAQMTDLAKHAAHADPGFTAKVYARGQLEAARRVAKSRVQHRDKNKG